MPSKKKSNQKKANWKDHQQKRTTSKPRQRARQNKSVGKIYMLTDYRHFAKKGQVWQTSETKANELVNLRRAEHYDHSNKAHKKAKIAK